MARHEGAPLTRRTAHMHASPPLRVLVVDDHAGIRRGVESLIEAEAPRMRSVGGAANPVEALRLAKTQQPDVVVLDVDLGGADGLALIPILLRTAPCGVLVLTSAIDPRVASRARRLGAHDFMHKTAPASELIARIEAVGTCPASGCTGHSNAGSAMSCEVGSIDTGDAGNTADAAHIRFSYSDSIDAAMHRSERKSNVITDRLTEIRRMCLALWRDERGVTSIEYGLMSALIVIVCISAFSATGASLTGLYTAWIGAVLAVL
jgi:two-component system, NarL family, nitrate/nitrite response regulator NarL